MPQTFKVSLHFLWSQSALSATGILVGSEAFLIFRRLLILSNRFPFLHDNFPPHALALTQVYSVHLCMGPHLTKMLDLESNL